VRDGAACLATDANQCAEERFRLGFGTKDLDTRKLTFFSFSF
jgi:hypothetical protein